MWQLPHNTVNLIRMIRFFLILFAVSFLYNAQCQGPIYKTSQGEVRFVSEAPLETIRAYSKSLQAVIDIKKNTFAFAIPIQSFQGFNSPLQREHFNENYLESHKYPRATFEGRIIERIDLRQTGTYTIRAKGQLTIHGIKQERIIKSKINIQETEMELESFFSILLEEYDITIPMIVYQKIAKSINVQVNAKLIKSTP